MAEVELRRDTVATPLEWNVDPFGESIDDPGRVRDVLEQVTFLGDDNDGPFSDGYLRGDIIEEDAKLGTTVEAALEGSDPDLFDTTFPDSGGNNTSSQSKEVDRKKRQRDAIPSVSLSQRRKKKPKGMPKRPLSAYNLYFQSERAKILEAAETGEGGKLGFEGLGKIIGSKWRVLTASERKKYDKLADKDSARYRREMKEYNQKKNERMEDSEEFLFEDLLRPAGTTPVPPDTVLQGRLAKGPSRTNAQQPQADILHNGEAPPPPLSAPMEEVPTAVRHAQVDGYAPRRKSPIECPHAFTPVSPNSRRQQEQRPLHPQYGADFGMALPSRHAVMTPPPHFAIPPHPEVMMSFPPMPHHGAQQVVLPPNQLPVPPGMEIVLPDRNGIDRKYRIKYTCFSMSRQAARQYVDSLSGSRPRAPASPGSW